jgi:hypothetical protein
MKHKTLPTTAGHFKSYGGEARTRMFSGTLLGAAVGFFTGIILCTMWSSGDFHVAGAEGISSPMVRYFLTVLATTLVGASAGATVGIGVPKIKTRPEQGLVKKWKPIPIEDEKHHVETVYVPEETRHNRKNNRENLEL